MADFLRGDDEEVASFFAFQDIIVAVLGIILLIALQFSFSINEVQGQDEDKDSSKGQFEIRELEYNSLKEKRINLEGELKELREQNAQQISMSLKYVSSLKNTGGLDASIKILEKELFDLKKDYSLLQDKVEQKEKNLKDRASILGISDIQENVSRLAQVIQEDKLKVAQLKRHLEVLSETFNDSEQVLLREKSKQDKIWMIPEADNDGKSPLLITVDKDGLTFEEFDKPESLRVLDTRSLTSSFLDGVKMYSPSDFKIVFLFKPSGHLFFEDLIELAKDTNFQVGYDAIPEKQKIIFSLPD